MPHFLFYLCVSISSSSPAKLMNLILFSLCLPRVSAALAAAEEIKLILSDGAVQGAMKPAAAHCLLAGPHLVILGSHITTSASESLAIRPFRG